MEADAKERVVRNINTEQEIDRQLKEYFGYKPSKRQVKSIESHITAEQSNNVYYNDKSNRYYIRTDDGKFRKVKEKSENIIVNSKSGDVFIRNESGKVKKVVK